jgi:hypothetical protein
VVAAKGGKKKKGNARGLPRLTLGRNLKQTCTTATYVKSISELTQRWQKLEEGSGLSSQKRPVQLIIRK